MWCAGHFIRDVEVNSSAESAGIKEKDRLVAVNGEEVEGWSHEEIVNFIRKSGSTCCFLVVDKFTDQMYKLVGDSTEGFPEYSHAALLCNDAILSLTGKGVPYALPRHIE